MSGNGDNYASFLANKIQVGADEGFEPVWMPEFLYGFQRVLTEWALRKGRAAILADCGLGKGSPPDTPVLTPGGFVPIGGITVGDEVIASDGLSYAVTGVYAKPVQDVFRFCYSDGASLTVDTDHLHICRTNNDRQRTPDYWRVLSTRSLLECGNLRYGKDDKSRNYDIPVVEPVNFATTCASDISPYVIGALLGDGCLSQSSDVCFSTMDSHIISRINREIQVKHEGVAFEHKDGCDYRLRTGQTGNVRHPFRALLYRLGMMPKLSYDKYVPMEYLHAASPMLRLHLLQGLMDTDGYIMKCGTSQFYSTSQQLAEDVRFIVRSLGGVPTFTQKQTILNGNRHRDCFVVTFSLKTYNPFSLPRKAERWNSKPRDNGRWIDRIEYAGQSETVCISVDSPDASYVTHDFVVTHNTPMQLVWAENVRRFTNRSVLIVTPLAVSYQTIREAEKFGIEATQSRDGKHSGGIVVTNYERLHYFDPAEFSGVVGDEGSTIKNFAGARRKIVTEFLRTIQYRLFCTATAAPNDYCELGTLSDALGYLGFQDMLTRFFKEDIIKDFHGWGRKAYRFRGHAEGPFWEWVCSWARACRKPSDLGFDDGDFVLPPLNEIEHVIQCSKPREGTLLALPARDLKEQRAERRETLTERCVKVAEIVGRSDDPSVTWCHLNDEADVLEKIIPDSLQVSGSMSDEKKEERLLAFQAGGLKHLITKPKIGCFGLNWQHCHRVMTFPSHSWEQYYQTVRRCWRFGQQNPVSVHIVTTEGEVRVLRNLQRKAAQADVMFADLTAAMSRESSIDRSIVMDEKEKVPQWL